MITFYGYKKCGTSRKGEKALQEMGLDFKFVDVTENPPSITRLKEISKLSGVPVRKMFNTSGKEYRDQNLKEKLPAMNDNDCFALLAGNGRLIKRPLVTDNTRATAGFQEDSFKKTWS